METKTQKLIVDFFSFTEEFYNTSRKCLKQCQNCAIAINNFILRCRKIKRADLKGTPLEDLEGLQGKLIAAIHEEISYEITDIRSNLTTIEELFVKLCSKHKALLESCREVNFDDQHPLITGTSIQPPLKQLLQFAEDILTFGAEIVAQIDTSLNVLTYKEFNTNSFVDNLAISAKWQLRIKEILAYTAFCAENQL